jgi:hypothetical protein
MTNKQQQMVVDSVIEFCQKQMENDSSIHKGVYLSIIKFCQEQITAESEIHWKTTLVTAKPVEMTSNKQQTVVEWLHQEMLKPNLSMKEILEQAKEMDKERMVGFTNKYINEELWVNCNAIESDSTVEQYYEKTYGGGEQ